MFFIIPAILFTGIGIISVESSRSLGRITSSPIVAVVLSYLMIYLGN
jgi:hypothetical protein